MSVSSQEVADFIDGEHDGPAVDIGDMNSINAADKDEIAFSVYEDPDVIRESDAGVVICPPGIPSISGRTQIKTENPRLAFQRVANEFFITRETGIHPTAVVEEGAEVGERCVIGPHVYVHNSVSIGDDCRLLPGAKIGVEGNAFQRSNSGDYLNNIHKGGVVLEDKVCIGANCVIDRGVFDETRVGRDTKLQNLIHVGHNTQIGEHVLINQFCSLAGSVEIGDEVRIHPHVSVANHVSVGNGATLAMCSGVLEDVEEGVTVVGTPAEPMDP